MSRNPHILVLCESSQSSWRDFLMGLVKYSRIKNAGWIFHLINLGSGDQDLEKEIFDNIQRLDIRAIIDGLDDPAMTERLLATGLPCFTHNPSQKEPFGKYIGTPDNAQIGKKAAAHFLDKHFVHFAYCSSGPLNWSQERGETFTDTIVRAGYHVQVYKPPALRGRSLWEKELPFLVKWLKTLEKPVGLMTDSDDRGRQVLEACQVAGLHVPEEAAVLGVGDDDFLCEFTCPPMSSIHVDTESGGYQMAQMFDRLMSGQELPPQTFASRVVGVTERQSTDVLAVEDKTVKQAIQFIRKNSTKPLSVSEVAEAISVTVRTLDRRFKKALGRSVHSEIARVRIEQVCRLLISTNLSISQIAAHLGYSDPADMRRSFRRVKGFSLSTYRDTYAAL